MKIEEHRDIFENSYRINISSSSKMYQKNNKSCVTAKFKCCASLSGCVTPKVKYCALSSADLKTTKTNAPFPVKHTKKSVILLKTVIMVKKKSQNNFLKSTPKAAADDDSSEGEGDLHRDLQQGRLGAAFIHPQRRIWAPETPANQNPAISQSADTSVAITESLENTVAVTESFDADDEQEKDSPQPSTYHRAYWYYRDYPEPDSSPNAVTCIHTCEHECALDNPEFRRAEYERLKNQRENHAIADAMLRDEPPPLLQMTFRSSDEQAEESMVELNEALNREAPIDTPLSESQILEQTTQDLDFNYDSRENLNYTESGETFEEFDAQLNQLLESMKQLSSVNQVFHEFFTGDDIDENWPRDLSPTEKIEQYEQCFNKIVQMDWQDIWAEWDFPDPNHFQRMIYRGPEIPRYFRTDKRIRRALSVRPGSPNPGTSRNTANLEISETPGAVRIAGARDYTEEQTYPRLDFSEITDEERDLLVKFAYRAEILSAQLNNVLGRPNFEPPLVHEGDTNTHRGLHIRYDFLQRVMDKREEEIPALNQNPNASLDHTTLINQRFLRASIRNDPNVQSDPSSQDQVSDQIDLSNSQADLNSNIQITYPETSSSSFSFAASTSYYTGNASNGNEVTGSGNDQFEFDETTNYQEFGQNLISRQLTSTNVGSYVAFDPLQIESSDGVNSTIETKEDEN